MSSRWDEPLRVATLVASLSGCVLGGVALWRTRGIEERANVAAASRATAQRVDDDDAPVHAAPRSLARRAQRPPGIVGPSDAPVAEARAPSMRTNGLPTAPPALAPLSDKLHVRGDALLPLVDESGRVPPGVEAKLTAAQSAAFDIATRLSLDEAQRDGIATVLVDLAIHEATASAHGATPDADAIASMREDAISAVRATAGERAADEAKRAIEKL